jgi:PAS domain S-box-containing protein
MDSKPSTGRLPNESDLELDEERFEREGAHRGWYQDLFATAPDSFLITDRAGLIRDANRAAAELFGVPRRFLVGKPFVVFVSRPLRAAFRSRLAAISGDHRSSFRIDLAPRGEESKTIEAAVAIRVLPGDGAEPRLHWVVRDLSARRRTEDQIRQLNAELERRVRERTAELEQANREKDELITRERHARIEADHANSAKDVFLAMLSHELRTPLNVVLGWTARLRRGGLDPASTAHALDVVERNIRIQTRLIEDLLDTSRLSRGDVQLERRPIDLLTVVEPMLDALRPSAELKKVRVNARLSPTGAVEGDPSRIQQIAWNLVTNAIKFTQPGGTVEVVLQREGDEAVLVVSDTGVGIRPDLLPHVFDPFVQADPSLTRSQGGLGLGLSIVKRLVELHGGRVDVSSAGDNEGATFRAFFPVAPEPRRVAITDPATAEPPP